MRTMVPLSLTALLILGFVAFAAPPAAASTTCGDIGCCKDFERGKTFLQCVECVAIGNDWDVDTNLCIIY